MSGILKRKFEEVDGSSPCSSVRESDDDLSSSESGDSSDSVNPSTLNHFTHVVLKKYSLAKYVTVQEPPVTPPFCSFGGIFLPTRASSILKREKRLRTKNVRFNSVTVYYFTRRQGFTSVPSQGGSTLGMSNRHNNIRQYTLGEFATEQDRLHREMLRDHLREEKLNSLKLKMTKNGTVESEEANTLTLDDISDDDIDLDNTEVDEYFFLQPLPTKKRRALLRASGVKKIDVEEKHELRAIRLSREDCGCECRIFCDPETCTCSLGGIKCQVDRMSFPCGCTKEGCSNTAGRIEFNPIRVRTHFLHTIMKLELEKNREQQAAGVNGCLGEISARDSPLTQVPHPGEYSIIDNCEMDTKPQTAIRHFQSFDGLDCQGDDDDDDEEEEEDEEDDGSSFCSVVTDSSTQSLAPSDTDDEDEEDEEDEDDDGEDDERSDGFGEMMGGASSQVVPLPSVLCYSDGTAVHDNHSKNEPYYPNAPPLYCQIEKHTGSATNQICEEYQDRDPIKNGAVPLASFNISAEQFARHSEESCTVTQCPNSNPSVIVCCTSSESDTSLQRGCLYPEHRPNQPPAEFHSYLKSPPHDGFGVSLNGNSCNISEESISFPESSKLREECITTPVVEPVTV